MTKLEDILKMSKNSGALFFRSSPPLGHMRGVVVVANATPEEMFDALPKIISDGMLSAQRLILSRHWLYLVRRSLRAWQALDIDDEGSFSVENRPLTDYVYVVEEDGSISWAKTEGSMSWNELDWRVHRHEGCLID